MLVVARKREPERYPTLYDQRLVLLSTTVGHGQQTHRQARGSVCRQTPYSSDRGEGIGDVQTDDNLLRAGADVGGIVARSNGDLVILCISYCCQSEQQRARQP